MIILNRLGKAPQTIPGKRNQILQYIYRGKARACVADLPGLIVIFKEYDILCHHEAAR
jgi:hypothetical protein